MVPRDICAVHRVSGCRVMGDAVAAQACAVRARMVIGLCRYVTECGWL